MSLGPERVERLRTKLCEKAKRESSYRFYSLYDKVCWAETLALAYQKAKANKGAPGVDGVGFEDIESYGVERWLDELRQELVKRAGSFVSAVVEPSACPSGRPSWRGIA